MRTNEMLSVILVGVYLLVGLPCGRAAAQCAMYGNCGRQSAFGAELPCPVGADFTPEPLSADDSGFLASVCGPEWGSMDYVCCTRDQMVKLRANLKKAEAIIASCPACAKNFAATFCHFTCSPAQRQFLDVKETELSTIGKRIVTEVDFYVESEYGESFYDSCKNVKFSSTNGYAMDLIGGGAHNYKEFLNFLGDKKPSLGGSPFQINFKYSSETGQAPLNEKTYACNDTEFRCACADCQESCPVLKPVKSGQCKVGKLPCLSFGALVAYGGAALALLLSYLYVSRAKGDGVLLQDDAMGDDNEELNRQAEDELFHEYPTSRYRLNDVLADHLGSVAAYCIKYPYHVLGATFAVVLILSSLIPFFGRLETDPVALWVSKRSPRFIEKQYFDENFGPFYRMEQIFIANDNGPVLSYEHLDWWFTIEKEITSGLQSSDNTTFQDLCLRPTSDSTCVIQSVTQYFDGILPPKSTWLEDLKTCAESPVSCLPSFQQPLNSKLLFSHENITESNALVISLPVDNHTQSAELWEQTLEDYLSKLDVPKGLRLSFSTESSLSKELGKNNDVIIVLISYVIMFFYASWALKNKMGKQRFLLGGTGILIVFCSILSAVGMLSALGLSSTLIIAEVIPFLILAIGVDNIFLLTGEYDRTTAGNTSLSIEDRILISVRKIAPSIVTSVVCQTVCFLLAAFVGMPAVRNFALYSAAALFFNFLFQITAFVSILTLYENKYESYLSNTSLEQEPPFFLPKLRNVILKKSTAIVFIVWSLASIVFLPYISIGLDQKMAVPQDSHLTTYFEDVSQYLNVGPPVYFVLRNLDLTKRENQKKICGKFTTCNEFSLANVLEQERNRSTITEPLTNWYDDFMMFLNPALDECCRLKKGSQEVCPPRYPFRRCQTCYPPGTWDYDMTDFPEDGEFMRFFKIWIDAPSEPCPLGGKAPYSSSIIYNDSVIEASMFRSYHSPLRTQKDYIAAYKDAERITGEFKDLDVFAYSPVYIFFDQYRSLVSLTLKLLAVALITMFWISLVMLGSVSTALLLTGTVFMILVDIGASMVLFNIPLNAVSLVNLVICVGLAVEFCIHIARAFTLVPVGIKNSRPSRSVYALASVGESVFRGITMTKLIGVCILFFAQSKIFQVFYFRMWLSLILIASLHALIFLPTALAFLGGQSYVEGNSEVRLVDAE
ncbi:FAGL008Wp [Eremothecium gossypii FDAG1]|nr:FAGL008Wp [Eremothecium gossypii FDAG1]